MLCHMPHEYGRVRVGDLRFLSRRTHPEVLPVEAGDLRMRGPDLVKVRQERVHVVQALDTFVKGGHDRFRVLGQFHARRLLLLCL